MDYLDTFAPVAKLASLRLFLARAAVEDLEIHQMDAVTAFLAEGIEEEIYMEHPEGFEEGEDLVCLLRRGLYGLKQSARLWNKMLDRRLKALGYKQLQSDHCVYINEKTGIIIAVWVDDLIIFGKGMSEINAIKAQLREEFEMKDVHNSNPVATPIATGARFSQSSDTNELVDIKAYQSEIRSLMSDMLCTRPDLAYLVHT